LRVDEKEAGVGVSNNSASGKPSYTVKDVELVMAGAQVQARVFTLAPGDSVPWHYHSEITDHYFVLRGTLIIKTREPPTSSRTEERRTASSFSSRASASTIGLKPKADR
jgi:quercetin dioxygenase-like cupin family protein